MSERDDRYARDDVPGLPSSTAEFRAMPDASASTAQFQAFAAGYDRSEARRPGPAASWPGPAGGAVGRRPARQNPPPASVQPLQPLPSLLAVAICRWPSSATIPAAPVVFSQPVGLPLTAPPAVPGIGDQAPQGAPPAAPSWRRQ